MKHELLKRIATSVLGMFGIVCLVCEFERLRLTGVLLILLGYFLSKKWGFYDAK